MRISVCVCVCVYGQLNEWRFLCEATDTLERDAPQSEAQGRGKLLMWTGSLAAQVEALRHLHLRVKIKAPPPSAGQL